MSEPYLIAHCVCGEAAFDIAKRMICPECNPNWSEKVHSCAECESLGYWWIIPTSGHRAYPYWNRALNDMELEGYPPTYVSELATPMPPSWPDHYHHGPSPKIDIKELFKSAPKPTIPRRL